MADIILASGSAIRATLLANAGVRVRIARPSVDERRIERELTAAGVAMTEITARLAHAKAQEASIREPSAWVIAADQTLHIGAEPPLAKVTTRTAAFERLRALSGRSHILRTATVLAHDGQARDSDVAEITVTLRTLSDPEIAAYLDAAGDSVLASVACYELEGHGVRLVERIDGDFFSALGLNLIWTLSALRRVGALTQ